MNDYLQHLFINCLCFIESIVKFLQYGLLINNNKMTTRDMLLFIYFTSHIIVTLPCAILYLYYSVQCTLLMK